MTPHQARVGAALEAFAQRSGGRHQGRAGLPVVRRSTTPEGRVLAAIRQALEGLPDLKVMRNSVGMIRTDGRVITYGLGVGSADLVCVLKPHGRWVCLEVKAPTGTTPTRAQWRWLEDMRAMGASCAVVRSVDDALGAVARARQEMLA